MQYFAICDFVLSCKPFKVYIFEICNFRRTRWEYFHFKEKAKNPIWPPLIMLPQRPLCTKLWTSSFLFSSLLWSSVFIVYFSLKPLSPTIMIKIWSLKRSHHSLGAVRLPTVVVFFFFFFFFFFLSKKTKRRKSVLWVT